MPDIRGRDSGADSEGRVDHNFLSHEDTDRDIGHNDSTKPVSIVSLFSHDPSEDADVDEEDQAKQTPVDGEGLVTKVANEPSVGLWDGFIFLVAGPDGFLLLELVNGRGGVEGLVLRACDGRSQADF